VAVSIEREGDTNNVDDVFTTNGKQGFDIYVQDPILDAPGWRWAATEGASSGKVNGSLVMRNLPKGSRNYTVYLPTYIAVRSLQIGVDWDAELQPLLLYSQEKPVAVWGSSIAQGGCVGNAGLTWPSCMQRLLDVPLLNFGFSGSCQMQLSVAKVIAEAKPRALVMDCLPNMQQSSPETVQNATLDVLRQLRADLGPQVPIVVLEGHEYTNNWIKRAQSNNQAQLCQAQNAAFVELQDLVPGLHYIDSDGKLGNDPEVADESTGGMGVHPSSLAHLHMADFVATRLRRILSLPSASLPSTAVI